MMEAPKSYESNGYQFDLVYNTHTNKLPAVKELIESAENIGLYSLVIPGMSEGYGNHDRYFLYFYKRTRIEVSK